MRDYNIDTKKEPKDINEFLIYRYVFMKVLPNYKDINSLVMGLKRSVTEYEGDYGEMHKVIGHIYMEIDLVYKERKENMSFSYHNEIQVINDMTKYFDNLK